VQVDVMGSGPVGETGLGRPSGVVVTGSFDDFYREEAGRVFGVVLALTGDRATAEDLTQEAFATAHRGWNKVAGYEQPGAWVRRVAVNRAISRFRRHQAERRALERVDRQPKADGPSGTSAFDDDLWRAVRALPGRQAQAIALTYVEDLSCAQVAAVLGCSEGSVKRHLSRGRAALAVQLAPTHNPDGEGGAR
jgi:RNA polymerase sigma-70 factor (ECF subfamily)